VIILCIPWDEIFDAESPFRQRISSIYHWFSPFANAVMLVLATVMLADSTYNPFIYFRF
jgi:hypothetical protein